MDLDLASLSDLTCSYATTGDDPRRVVVLVMSVAGTYRPGSLGSGDGALVAADALRGLVAFDAGALVLDLRELAYSWGDGLLRVYQVVADHEREPGEARFPVATVTSADNDGAIRSLMGAGPAEGDGMVFRDLDAATSAAQAAYETWLDSA